MTQKTKRTYEKPELNKHAQLREVTLSSVGSGGSDTGGGDGKGKG